MLSRVGGSMLALLLAAHLSLAQQPKQTEEGRDDKGGYMMNNVGAWIYLPPGMTAEDWTDDSFSAKTADEGVEVKLWKTDYQVDISMEALQAWGKDYIDRIDKLGGANPKVTRAELHDWGDKKGGQVEIEFNFKEGNVKGYAYHAVMQSAGQMIHIRALAAGRNAAKAQAALEQVATGLKRVKEPFPVQTGELVSQAGFSITVPEGWRAPVGPEIEKVLHRGEMVGIDEIGPERCATALRPPAMGDLDAILACKQKYFLGIVDEYSWAGEEKVLFDMYHFEEAKIPHAEKVQVGDRLGFAYKAREGEKPMRLTVAPYDGGLLLLWGIAGQMDAASLDATMAKIIPTVKFSGPNGGNQLVSLEQKLGYYIKHRTFSPIVLVPSFLIVAILIGGILWLRRFMNPPVVDI
jgi:hypothetical protein